MFYFNVHQFVPIDSPNHSYVQFKNALVLRSYIGWIVLFVFHFCTRINHVVIIDCSIQCLEMASGLYCTPHIVNHVQYGNVRSVKWTRRGSFCAIERHSIRNDDQATITIWFSWWSFYSRCSVYITCDYPKGFSKESTTLVRFYRLSTSVRYS